jgi:hypothetical protein
VSALQRWRPPRPYPVRHTRPLPLLDFAIDELF